MAVKVVHFLLELAGNVPALVVNQFGTMGSPNRASVCSCKSTCAQLTRATYHVRQLRSCLAVPALKCSCWPCTAPVSMGCAAMAMLGQELRDVEECYGLASQEIIRWHTAASLTMQARAAVICPLTYFTAHRVCTLLGIEKAGCKPKGVPSTLRSGFIAYYGYAALILRGWPPVSV